MVPEFVRYFPDIRRDFRFYATFAVVMALGSMPGVTVSARGAIGWSHCGRIPLINWGNHKTPAHSVTPRSHRTPVAPAYCLPSNPIEASVCTVSFRTVMPPDSAASMTARGPADG